MERINKIVIIVNSFFVRLGLPKSGQAEFAEIKFFQTSLLLYTKARRKLIRLIKE